MVVVGFCVGVACWFFLLLIVGCCWLLLSVVRRGLFVSLFFGISCYFMFVSCWSLVVGFSSLVVVCWLLVVGWLVGECWWLSLVFELVSAVGSSCWSLLVAVGCCYRLSVMGCLLLLIRYRLVLFVCKLLVVSC